MTNQIDYIIVGQGLVGTWMSYYTHKAGKSFVVINDPNTPSATSVASGVINPVTGRRIVQTWMIDTLLSNAVNAYKALGNDLNKTLIKEAPVVLLHPSLQMKESFEYRLTHDNVYLSSNDAINFEAFFTTPFGTGQIDSSFWIDLNTMLEAWKKKLIASNSMIQERFELTDLVVEKGQVQWKNYTAKHIIFCDGNNSMQNTYFNRLPFAPNKGEALIVSIEGLPNQFIYKQAISIVPWKDNLFWVGSNYEWDFKDALPSIAFKEKMIQALDSFLKVPYTIIDHISGTRPANTERRPFVGVHPAYPSLAICNGMGTKGCSLAPYFTKQLIDYLVHRKSIHEEADIQRFESILKYE
jgi:glycine/D-amino acid oxidase-like deaminating enzyme